MSSDKWEGIDPKIQDLEPEEQDVVFAVFNSLGKRTTEIMHEIGTEETFFQVKFTHIKKLMLIDVAKAVRPHMQSGLFRHYEILPDKTGICLLVTFYRATLKGNKALPHEITSDEIRTTDMTDMLARTTLSEKEQKDAVDMLQQFCFVESHASGAISASIDVNPDRYVLIFSNVQSVSSGFLRMYMNTFKEQNPSVSFVAPPFEVHLTILRKSAVSHKRKTPVEEGKRSTIKLTHV